MKTKTILFTFLLGITTVTCFAQDDCKMCGDWVGVYQTAYPRTEYERDNAQSMADFKEGKVIKYIRINKFGDSYKIRIKTIYEGFTGCVYEQDKIDILKTTDYSIYYKKTTEMDAEYDVNDRVMGYSNLEYFFLITYDNGYMQHEIVDVYVNEYDRNKNLIRKYQDSALEYAKNPSWGYNIDLYKEENDW